ncbi:MAG: hypothetical protein AMR96_04180 [Candidatus Adiutrix intracellularis]|jgi:D-glycero-D-manno-heptose 1,7-bisphosphate phosphatase|nr:MAG: hypothetical protein AMR96_04180 [Candidatus Adiutrix intracellularis]MDR2827289.1 D-glycero-beta-D-manno-heptose 1,7-bisphosphate 7-phosphatase [Candidatus Adiutrix intracellularis]
MDGSSDRSAAVFLDRDGTMSLDLGYLYLWDDWQWLPGAPEALTRLKEAGYKLVVVTNQSGVARGYFDEAAVKRLHQKVNMDLRTRFKTTIDAFYFCPHHPNFNEPCACRKPAPGMLQRAAAELGLDLARSFMIGDKPNDLLAGRAAGCISILLRNDDGRRTEPMAVNFLIADDLAAAAALILKISE